jgi:hypothetical protein
MAEVNYPSSILVLDFHKLGNFVRSQDFDLGKTEICLRFVIDMH